MLTCTPSTWNKQLLWGHVSQYYKRSVTQLYHTVVLAKTFTTFIIVIKLPLPKYIHKALHDYYSNDLI